MNKVNNNDNVDRRIDDILDKRKSVYQTASKSIDWNIVRELAHDHCTVEEIIAYFGTSFTTINRRCLEKFNKTITHFCKSMQKVGKADLRTMQFELARQNATMAKHLGVNYLGQRDKIEITTTELSADDKYDFSKLTKEELIKLNELLNKAKLDTEEE